MTFDLPSGPPLKAAVRFAAALLERAARTDPRAHTRVDSCATPHAQFATRALVASIVREHRRVEA